VQIDSENPKVGRRRRLKKCQVDSTDDDNNDASYRPAAKGKHNASSIFDSCSEDEDLKPITINSKKDSTKTSEEVKHSNVQTKDGIRKKSTRVQKRKSSAISEDPASPMYTSLFLCRHISVSIILSAF
jgi:FK506-binding nuclear protein